MRSPLRCTAAPPAAGPEGRRSEDGAIPAVYPVRELPGAGYAQRTLQNVRDSDGTALVFAGVLEGGTRLTRSCCIEVPKPWLLIDAAAMTPTDAVDALVRFIARHGIETLNVAGPRASRWPEAYDYARRLLTGVLTTLDPP